MKYIIDLKRKGMGLILNELLIQSPKFFLKKLESKQNPSTSNKKININTNI
jgi:hypothetical protein